MEMTLTKTTTMDVIGKQRTLGAKQVLCITEGKTFMSVSDAAEYYGVHPSSVSKACRKGKTLKGMKFCYVSETKEHLPVIADEIQTSRKGNLDQHSTQHRKIKCIETGVIYRSICNASKEINIPRTTLYRHLEGRLENLNGNHYVFVNPECTECVKEMDPIIEKANAWDNLMAKKNRISDLRNEIKDGEIRRDEINAKLRNLTMEIESLTNELEFIDHGYQVKANEIYELTHEIEKEMGLTL